MRKGEVYSWRVSSERLQGLARAARLRKRSVASLLDQIAAEWLASNEPQPDQRRINEAVEKAIGSFRSGHPHRATNVSRLVREIIRKKHERETSR